MAIKAMAANMVAGTVVAKFFCSKEKAGESRLFLDE
jgi:hypothetical protein